MTVRREHRLPLVAFVLSAALSGFFIAQNLPGPVATVTVAAEKPTTRGATGASSTEVAVAPTGDPISLRQVAQRPGHGQGSVDAEGQPVDPTARWAGRRSDGAGTSGPSAGIVRVREHGPGTGSQPSTSPTSSPTEEPTATPTDEPTATPTDEPSGESTPESTPGTAPESAG